MEMEKNWWRNKLAADIYSTLRMKEQMLPTFLGQSPQLWARRHLVDWLSLVVEELGVASTAHNLSVYLLDYFLDVLEVEQDHLYLLALACLQIAAKFEEHCDKVPSFAVLNNLIPKSYMVHGYTPVEYIAMELTVLKYFDWQISLPTAAHFMPYFLMVAVDGSDLHNGLPIASKELVESYLEKNIKYFMEISLQDHIYRDYHPSMIAAACIAATRICLHLTPVWPKQLELMTDYYLEELLPSVQIMLSVYSQDGENQNARNRIQEVVTHSHVPIASYGDYAIASQSNVPVTGAYAGYTNYVYKQPVAYSATVYTTYTTPVYPLGPHIVHGCRGS